MNHKEEEPTRGNCCLQSGLTERNTFCSVLNAIYVTLMFWVYSQSVVRKL